MSNKSLPRRLKTKAQILSAFVSAFGRTLITPRAPTLEAQALSEIAPGSMRIWAQNVSLFLDDAVVLKLRDFVADLAVRDPDRPLIPELTDSYVFVLRAGEIRISAASMEALLNRYILPSVGHPLKEARLSISGDRLILRGKVRRMGMDLPITLESEVGLGEGGMIELVSQRIALSEVGLGGVFKLFNLALERLMDLPDAGAFRVSGNRILLDPTGIFPAPKAEGYPTRVFLERGFLVLAYACDTPIEPPPLIDPAAPHYLLGLGHDLLIGKMVVHDAYFQIVNQEAASHLDFSLERYREQLAAGTSSLQASDQLLVRLPNLDRGLRSPTGPI